MIDTHAHLYLCEPSLKDLVTQASEAGLTHIINIGINIDTSLQALETHTQYPHMIYPTIGIHPCESPPETDIKTLHSLVQEHPFVAIGESGLDYVKGSLSKEDQRDLFVNQLIIAKEHQLPIIIHNRHADDDIKAITDDFPDVPKLLHCFSSSLDFAEKIYSETTYYSFAGNITYAKKGKTINALRHLPLDHLFVETDAPYLTPKQCQGQRNQPAYVIHTLEKLCTVKNISYEDASQKIKTNALTFFGIL